MPSKLRFEFYLPSSYNTGKNIPFGEFRKVKDELLVRFKGVSLHPPNIHGYWIDPETKESFKDICCRFEITVDKTQNNQDFFVYYKKQLKKRFQQEEIYMFFTEIFVI